MLHVYKNWKNSVKALCEIQLAVRNLQEEYFFERDKETVSGGAAEGEGEGES